MTISPLSDLRAATETTTAAAPQSGVNKDTFLQLLVAQIKNQNPLNPADGVQFLSQLAQFSELEQMMGIRSEVASLRTELTESKETPEEKKAGDV